MHLTEKYGQRTLLKLSCTPWWLQSKCKAITYRAPPSEFAVAKAGAAAPASAAGAVAATLVVTLRLTTLSLPDRS